MSKNNSLSKLIFLSPPHTGGKDLRFVQKAFESNYIAPLGPRPLSMQYLLIALEPQISYPKQP